MQAIFIAALFKLLPIVFGELGALLVKLVEAAKPIVEKISADHSFPDGAARHEFVKTQLLPLIKKSGLVLLDAVQEGLVNVATKFAYEILKGKLSK